MLVIIVKSESIFIYFGFLIPNNVLLIKDNKIYTKDFIYYRWAALLVTVVVMSSFPFVRITVYCSGSDI
jgi:hypothetical protein